MRRLAHLGVLGGARPTRRRPGSGRSARRRRPASRRPGQRPGCLRYWAGWLQICFNAVSSLNTRPARSMPCGGDRLHRLADDRLVQRDLLGSAARTNPRLGLAGRPSGAMPRIGLAAAQQERSDQRGEPGGRLGVPVPLTGIATRLVHPRCPSTSCRPVEDGPQFRQSVFPPVFRQRIRRREGPQFAGGACHRRFLACWACGVGDDQAPAGLASSAESLRPRRRDQDDLVDARSGGGQPAPVVPADRNPPGQPAHLLLPGAKHDAGRTTSVGRSSPPAGADAARSPGSSCRAPCHQPGSRRPALHIPASQDRPRCWYGRSVAVSPGGGSTDPGAARCAATWAARSASGPSAIT